jgi:RimJ/RimL family protein N-acetyltransferase
MLKGDRIYLDTLDCDENTSAIRLVRNDPRIRNWCRQHTLITEDNHAKWLHKIDNDSSIKMFTVKLRTELPSKEGMFTPDFGSGDLVGVVGLTDINLIHRRAEFSCYIFPEYQRRGYAIDALQTLFRHGFDDWNLHSIWGETFDGNPALSLFTDKLGMIYEGTRRHFYFKNGKYLDALIISITEDEFRERCNS